MQFYARFQDEVVDEPAAISGHVARAREQLSPAFRPDLRRGACRGARAPAHCTRPIWPPRSGFITIYHLILEATLGLTSYRFVTAYLERERLLPGFVDGYSPHPPRRDPAHRLRRLVPPRDRPRPPRGGGRSASDAARSSALGRRGAEAAGRRRGNRPGRPRRERRRHPLLRTRRPGPPARHHRRAASDSLRRRSNRRRTPRRPARRPSSLQCRRLSWDARPVSSGPHPGPPASAVTGSVHMNSVIAWTPLVELTVISPPLFPTGLVLCLARDGSADGSARRSRLDSRPPCAARRGGVFGASRLHGMARAGVLKRPVPDRGSLST